MDNILKSKIGLADKLKKLLVVFMIGLISLSCFAQDWLVVEPKYPIVDDIVAAFSVDDYGATGDGLIDVTTIFQSLLDQLGSIGGGTLFVPEGKYVINGNLTIPRRVILRGEWKKPVKGEPIVGTILMAYAGRGDENATPFISMKTSTAIMDMVIWYPEQLPNNITPYPPTILYGYPGQWGNDFCNTRNVTLVNSYSGVIFSRDNGGGCPVINGLYGTPLSRGVEIDNIADVGRFEWIDFSPDYWSGSGLPNAPAKGGSHERWIHENGTGIVMRRNDWSYTCYTNIEGYAIGYLAGSSIASDGTPNGHHYSMNFKGCKTAVYFEATNDVGILFSKVTISNCETAVGVGPGTSGTVQFHSCSFDADTVINIDESSTTKMVVLKSMIENGKVNLEGGTITMTDCDFNNDAPQIEFRKNSRGIITGNRFAKGIEITNNSIMESIIDHAPVELESIPEFPVMSPQIRQPARMVLYVVTEAPYNARNDGTTDNTYAIQSALDQAYTDGGGIVFLPPGNYRVNGTLTVPIGVELKGASDLSTTPTGGGSILEVYAGKGSTSGTSFLTLQQGSGVRGITFNYPEQTYDLLPSPNLYPYCIQGAGNDVYIINVALRATYLGIDLFTNKCDNHYVDYLTGHVLKNGIRIGGGSNGGMVSNTQFNTLVFACGGESKWGSWPNSSSTCENDSYDYNWANMEFMILGDCQDQLLYNDFHYGSKTGIVLTSESGSGPQGMSMGLGIDGSKIAMRIDAVHPDGFDFVNTQIVAIGDQNTKYIETGVGLTSEIKMLNSDFWGSTLNGIVMNGGTLNIQSANFLHPGQNGLAQINLGTLVFENVVIKPTSALANSGAEASLHIRSSIVDPNGIIKENCALWKNNLSNSPSVSTDAAISRSGWTVSASNNSGVVYNSIDGVASTRWDTQGSQVNGQWFSVKFTNPEKIDHLLLDVAGSPNDSPQEYEMFVSDNGVDWYGPAVSGVGSSSLTIISFPSTTVQYVRLVQTGMKGNYWSIHELNVFGDDASISVDGISLDSESITLKKDSTKQLVATIAPDNAENKKVFWLSSNYAIATVDKNGLVTAITNGDATITAVTMDGIQKASIVAHIGTDGTTSIETIVNPTFNLNLYPNPVHNKVNLSFNVNKIENCMTIELLNMNGMCVRSFSRKVEIGNNQASFSVDGLAKGVYFVRLSSDFGSQTKKIVIR